MFKLEESGTNLKTEILAGISVFFALIYILVLQANLLAMVGISFEQAVLAVVLMIVIGCFSIGFFVNRPVIICSYLGEVAFATYVVVHVYNYSYLQSLACAFIAALIFLALSLSKYRLKLINGIPETIKLFFSVAIGLFLILIGLIETGLVFMKSDGLCFDYSMLSSYKFILCAMCFVLISLLKRFNIMANILIAFILTTVIAYFTGHIDISGIDWSVNFQNPIVKPDFGGILNIKFIPIILSFLVMLFCDTNVMMIAIFRNMKSENIEIKDDTVKNSLKTDALVSAIAPFLGTVSAGIYPESVIGIGNKGKTGLVPIVVGILFLLSLFLVPLIKIVPTYVCAGVLIFIGAVLVQSVKDAKIDRQDYCQTIPALMSVVLTCATLNLAVGICGAFALYLILKILSGKIKEISPEMWVLGLFSIVFFLTKISC